MLESTKIPKNNSTGCKGVYLIRGKYVAKIVFQKKAYYLGTYTEMQTAVEARKEAEEAIFQTALQFHAAWQKRAAQDPQWAKENPIGFKVKRNQNNCLYLEITPELT